MKVVLCGQRTFGRLALGLLLGRGDEVALVVAPRAQADGREDLLFGAAAGAGLPLLQAGGLSAGALPGGVDLIVAAHSHDFISAKTLGRTRLGGIGYHPSLLPRHRGRDAVRWAIKLGDPVTGGTVYWLTEGVDAGPIARQAWCWIRPGDTAGELWRRELRGLGIRLLGEALGDLDAGRIVMVPQDEALATWEPSWEREPLFRPDLPRIGPAPAGYEVIVDEHAAISGR
jgi:methionyl-tRNA formyltransferase